MIFPPFRTALLLTAVLLCCHLEQPGLLNAGQAATRVPAANLVQQGGYVLADNDRIIAAENSDTPFVPASTLKLITSLAALDILGPDYRFPTRIFSDDQENLYIQGSGDPFLLTEDIIAIAKKLRESGIRRINNLILDDTAFAIPSQADGNENSANPYDAWNSALAVNFNSIAIHVGQDRAISPDDPKVPPLPIMRTLGTTLPPGHYQLNVNAFPASGYLSNTLRYTGELFAGLLARQQIPMDGKILTGKAPAHAHPLLTSWSEKTVRDMLHLCLKYSNNFVANQLFLTCGTARFGVPATWDKGRAAMRDYIRGTLGLPEPELTVVEGSGLSRQNRITPRAMITALREFAPFMELLPVKHGVPLKSGTLTGVYCYAGYIPQQQDAPFVILLNQPQNNRDEILGLLMNRQDKKIIAVKK
jgi:D-alanyl-D-alanine carboxypeptidase/D-alanyl-D-alanine-endopeptidase (penicillin-binding protein 4)